MDFMPEQPGLRKASKIPTPDEDRDVAHSAFMHAFENAKPEHLHIPGMQEFAGAVSSRAGRIHVTPARPGDPRAPPWTAGRTLDGRLPLPDGRLPSPGSCALRPTRRHSPARPSRSWLGSTFRRSNTATL